MNVKDYNTYTKKVDEYFPDRYYHGEYFYSSNHPDQQYWKDSKICFCEDDEQSYSINEIRDMITATESLTTHCRRINRRGGSL